MNRTKSQQGFTLIELIVVIVILGILAVTAAPKFIDISGDAGRAQRQGVITGIQGAMQNGYAIAKVRGHVDGALQVNGLFINYANSYPSPVALLDGTGADAANATNFVGLMNNSGISLDGTSTTASFTHTIQTDCTITVAASTGADIMPVIDGVATSC